MSGRSDNIFARWARRKQAVRESEAHGPDREEGNFDQAAAQRDAESADPPIAAAGPDAEHAEPLPRLEDLTGESDLSAFLREGVPEALRSAALRKVWSLDPAIRDYIGPSEYAWDFNQPGSMAGFGSLDAGEAVSEFLATMSGGVRAGLDLTANSPETSPLSSDTAAGPPAHDAGAAPDDVAAAASARVPPVPSSPSHLVSDRPAGEAEVAVQPDEQSRAAARSRHGGALPR